MPYTINPKQIISLCAKSLQYYDNRLVDHGLRVSYITDKMLDILNDESIDRKAMFLLSLFHDIGAYKTEEIDNMIEFETRYVKPHSIYGYLFLKYLSPLKDLSEVLLYHHTPYKSLLNVDETIAKYAQIIFTADRADIALASNIPVCDIVSTMQNTDYFDEKYLNALDKAINENNIFSENWHETAVTWFDNEIDFLHICEKEARLYLKMIIQTIEFKSNVTMIHSINTMTISVFLAQKLGLSQKEIDMIYYGALVHDIGKIAIDSEILEFTGIYNDFQMSQMQKHVNFTEEILRDTFNENIVKIAVSHHEKLNGSGYPFHTLEKDLSLSEKIVVVSDITSALVGARKYKESYSWSRSIEILYSMCDENLIDRKIVDVISENTDVLEEKIERISTPILKTYIDMQMENQKLLNEF